MSEDLISLQDIKSRFEDLKDDELEIVCELTLPVTISVYRGGKMDDGSIPPLYCYLQYGEGSYTAYLVKDGNETDKISTFEETSEAFDISIDSKIWEISLEDTPE